jgi:predicted N-acetyltransferase YhbS
MTTEVLPGVTGAEIAEESTPTVEVGLFDVNNASNDDLYVVFELLRARFGGRMPLRKSAESEEGAVSDLHRALRQYVGCDFIVARDKNKKIIGVATGKSLVSEDEDEVCPNVEAYEAGYLAVHPRYEGQGIDEELAWVQIDRVRKWGHRIMSIVADPVTTKIAAKEHAKLMYGENGVIFAVFPELPKVESGE